MAKGTVIVDIPTDCEICDYCHTGVEAICSLSDNFVDRYVMQQSKPEWCPIEQVPERKNVQYDCDSILGGTENDKYVTNN